jgi:hypothetical protein
MADGWLVCGNDGFPQLPFRVPDDAHDRSAMQFTNRHSQAVSKHLARVSGVVRQRSPTLDLGTGGLSQPTHGESSPG